MRISTTEGESKALHGPSGWFPNEPELESPNKLMRD